MGCQQTPPASVDPAALTAIALSLRANLRAHVLTGINTYPLTPGLHRFVGGPCERATSPNNSVASARPGGADKVGLQPAPPPVADQGIPSRSDDFDRLRANIAACGLCGLSGNRQGQVHGRGGTSSGLLFVGDYSRQNGAFSSDTLFGAEEDAMLWNMVRAIGLSPEEVRVTNAVQCCPPCGGPPDPESGALCQAYLLREILLVRPRLICAMGEGAAAAVLGGSESVLRLRGRLHPYGPGGETSTGVQVVVTFHPRLLLEQPEWKKAAWEDLQMVQRHLRQRPGP